MRAILFRGKRVDNDDWVYGYFTEVIDPESGEKASVIVTDIFNVDATDNIYFVDPFTVGEFTGKVDADGNKIFEGDVLGIVEAKHGAGMLIVSDIRESAFLNNNSRAYKIIGNIHDGELIFGGKE